MHQFLESSNLTLLAVKLSHSSQQIQKQGPMPDSWLHDNFTSLHDDRPIIKNRPESFNSNYLTVVRMIPVEGRYNVPWLNMRCMEFFLSDKPKYLHYVLIYWLVSTTNFIFYSFSFIAALSSI